MNVLTGVYKLFPVHVPIFCNNSYQAEVCVAWVVLQSRVPSASVWRGATWIHSPTSLRWKVGMMAPTRSNPLYFSAAGACTASGKSHTICTLISGKIS